MQTVDANAHQPLTQDSASFEGESLAAGPSNLAVSPTARPLGADALRDHRDSSPALPSNSFWRQPDVVGTVIAADAVYYEPPDFDGIRFLSRALLLIELLGLPFLLLWALLKFAGPLSLVLGLLGLYLFFKFISPSNLFALLGIFHFLSPARSQREEQVPVQYLRIRDHWEQEHIVRRKGHLRYGHLMPGDEVALWGRRRSGMLDLRRGVNLQTKAAIAVQGNYSWIFLALNLLIVGIFIGLFYEPLSRILHLLTR